MDVVAAKWGVVQMSGDGIRFEGQIVKCWLMFGHEVHF